jgi:uncharacterized protein
MIDISRLTVYVPAFLAARATLDYPILASAVLAAMIGAIVGNRYLKSVTMKGIQNIVALLLFAVAVGLISGVF